MLDENLLADLLLPDPEIKPMPLYKTNGKASTKRRLAWRALKVGQSFTIPFEDVKNYSISSRTWFEQKYGIRFAQRRFIEDGKMILRIWRVE